jgi:hypothetical protein
MQVGEQVTVVPADTDPYVLEFQRYATITRTYKSSAYVRLRNVTRPDREFGPIPFARLLPGWKTKEGRWREW